MVTGAAAGWVSPLGVHGACRFACAYRPVRSPITENVRLESLTYKKSQAGKPDLLLLLFLVGLLAALVDRQEAVLDRQRQHRHRRAVVGAILRVLARP